MLRRFFIHLLAQDYVAELAYAKKLQRVSTYRMVQGLSNIIFGLSGGTKDLDTFKKPANLILRPVKRNELRIVQRVGAVDNAMIVDEETTDVVAVVVPEDLSLLDIDQCILGLDEGPQCIAFAGYAGDNDFMLDFDWDWVHRLIRDIKGPYAHVLGGIFLKATESGPDWGLCGQLSAHFSGGLNIIGGPIWGIT